MGLGSGLSAQIGYAEEVYTNEVQTISGTPSATFGLNFDGALTPVNLPTNASASAIQAALEALPNIGTGGVVCTGGPLPSAVTVTFSGTLVQKLNVPTLTVQGAVTGLTFNTTTPGTGYGDYQAPSRFLEFVSESMQLQQDYIESAAIRAGTFVRRSDRRVVNRKGAGGQVTHEVASNGYGLLFKHMMGAVNIATPSGGTLTRDQTFTLADLWNLSLTMQKGVPRQFGVAANVDPFSYVGTKVMDWTISNSVDGLLQLVMTLDAQDETLAQSLAAASFPAGQTLLSFLGGQITIAGANEDVTSFSLTRTSGQKGDRRYLRNSALQKQPIIADVSDITGSIEIDYEASTAYQRFTSGAIASLTALWEGPIIETTFKTGVLITLPAVQFTGETPKIDGPGVIMQPLPFKVLNDGTNEPVTIRYRTTDTAV